jgi:predicted DNA-binding antitoxin AbrB/MazE fold protein
MLVCSHNAVMKTLTIRGVPEELHEKLKLRAKQNRRSLNQEIIAGLAQGEADANNFAGSGLSKTGYFLQRSEQLQSGVFKPLTAAEISQGIKESRR